MQNAQFNCSNGLTFKTVDCRATAWLAMTGQFNLTLFHRCVIARRLIHVNGVSDSVEEKDYYCKIINFGELVFYEK